MTKSPQHKLARFFNILLHWEKSYIEQTSRHLKTRLNEHIPKCKIKFIIENTNNKINAVVNATKRSSIEEHLINNTDCVNNCDLSRFKVINNFTNSIDLFRLEAI